MPHIFRDRRREASGDPWAWSGLEPEVREALGGRIERELARRSMFGSLVYFIVTVIVGFSTPYYFDHSRILVVTAVLTLVAGLARIIAAQRLQEWPVHEIPRTKLIFRCAIYSLFAIWGAFCGWTLHLYAGEWTAMLLLLSTASLAGGGTSSLAPDLRLALRCLTIMFAPTIVVALTIGEARHFGLALLATIYLAFLLLQARGNWSAFWGASVAMEREKIRGSAERRKAETERASLVTAIEQAAEEIVITNINGDIEYCNPSFERLSGYSRAEVIGRNPRFLKSGKHDEEFYRSMWVAILSGKVWTGRFINRRKDGSLYEAEGTISPIHDAGGRLTGFVSARHDVTERLRMEGELRQAQKMESIGRLAGGIAHDFNNLLTVITGYSSALRDRLATEDPLREYVGEIRRSADRAASLTRQLLTFSRKQIIAPKPVDLNALVADTQRMLQRLVGEDVDIVFEPGTQLGLVRVDPDQMNQILMNLAANARDAMPGGGRLTLRTANADLPAEPELGSARLFSGPAVMLSVSDTGVGISEEARQHIFEPFFTMKDQGRGTGLGLSTVYGIVQQSNGVIEVDSEPGGGTTFTLYLPRIEGRPEQDSATNSTGSLRGSETVLVVEDQDDVRRLIIGALRYYGFHVMEAANGGLALLEADRYSGQIDLLLTDVIMPDMSGRVLADRLKESRPGTKVLYVSGYSGELIAHRGVLNAGVSYLPKPFTPEVLAAKVRQVLGPTSEVRSQSA
jgi:PAS domain S-box-containing protein